MLEDEFEVLLVNPAHLKGVPGRKTDLLTELPDRSLSGGARGVRSGWLGSVLVINDGDCAAGVVRVGGAAARVA